MERAYSSIGPLRDTFLQIFEISGAGQEEIDSENIHQFILCSILFCRL